MHKEQIHAFEKTWKLTAMLCTIDFSTETCLWHDHFLSLKLLQVLWWILTISVSWHLTLFTVFCIIPWHSVNILVDYSRVSQHLLSDGGWQSLHYMINMFEFFFGNEIRFLDLRHLGNIRNTRKCPRLTWSMCCSYILFN